MNDKVTVRFFYNLGIEYFKHLQQVYGYGGVMAMIDGDSVSPGYDQSPSVANDVDSTMQNQLNNDFQQMNFDTNEIEAQSPPKVIHLFIVIHFVCIEKESRRFLLSFPTNRFNSKCNPA